jgi:outer membrane protein assembly factor BamB
MNTRSSVLCGAVALIAFLDSSAVGKPWPGWRGPEGTGIASEKDIPLKWSATENTRWRVELPERGNSSPIVWEDRVFVTQAVSATNSRTLMCFDRATGKLLWQSGPTYAERESTQRDNPYCSATPVTDGERVIASFGSAGLYCYDFAGKEIWRRDFGRMEHMFGNAASPMLAGDLCVLNFGPDAKARLIAVNKRTGETAWEAQPPKAEPGGAPQRGVPGRDLESSGRPQGGFGGQGRGPGRSGPGGPGRSGGRGGPGGGASWSTPVLVSADGHKELVISYPGSLVAYAPATGKELWRSKGIGATIYASPLFGQGTLVAMSSGPGGGSAMAVKPGGNGDVTETQRLWRLERFKSGIGSGVIHDGYLYTITQEGIAACTDMKEGKTVWEERLKGSGSRGSSWSSLLLADGRIYVPNQAGDVFVLAAAPKFELLATNSVNEPTNASLAVSDGELFLRTDKALWCIASPKH